MNEPKESFPYKAPSEELKIKYSDIFSLDDPVNQKMLKTIFDKLASGIILLISLPILLILKVVYLIEGFFIPENGGPMFFYYLSVSHGKIIKKYKIRIIKEKFIDKEAASRHEWIAYSKEWSPESRTITGNFVKKWYLDELPQFYSIFKGDMSFVGPRPLSILHYERDLAQGNVCRKLIKGGLLGYGHIHKGTSEMGNPQYEYEYIKKVITYSQIKLFSLDLFIIWKGFLLVIKGGGH
mgnify:FL=1